MTTPARPAYKRGSQLTVRRAEVATDAVDKSSDPYDGVLAMSDCTVTLTLVGGGVIPVTLPKGKELGWNISMVNTTGPAGAIVGLWYN